MTSYVALLRGVNLLGVSTLRMADLRAIADELGLGSPRTFIASGNLLFLSRKSEGALKSLLQDRIKVHMGREIKVMVRTGEEMAKVTEANPFADQPGNRVVAVFLDDAPPKGFDDHAKHATNERMAPGTREIYVHYPDGQGSSKLQIPAAASGTARNMNSVAKLAELAKERS